MTTLNDDEDENETQTKMYEDHNEYLHGKKKRGKNNQIISSKFIKKYLYVAKMQSPKLTKVSTIFFTVSGALNPIWSILRVA